MDGPNWHWRALGAGALIAALLVWVTLNPKADTAWQFTLAGTEIFLVLGIAVEIGNGWHLAVWRDHESFDNACVSGGIGGALPGFMFVWIGTTCFTFCELRGWDTGRVRGQPYDPFRDLPYSKQIIFLVVSAVAAALTLRLRIWILKCQEQGLGGWQMLRDATRGIFSSAFSKASNLPLFIENLAMAIVGCGLLWLLLTYVPIDPFGNDVGYTGTDAWARRVYVIGYVVFALLLAAAVAYGIARTVAAWRGSSELKTDTHGQARTATEGELRRAKLSPYDSGIYLGHFLNAHRPKKLGPQVEYPGGVHLITIGRTGIGKGTGLIIPNLADLRRSVLVIDPKGEAAAITARKRARFGRVVVLNPFNLLAKNRPWMKSQGFNPLSTIRMDENFLDDCTIIGQSLVKQEKGANGRFFSGSAHDLVTALVMHEKITRQDEATIGNVRAMLTEPFEADRETGLPVGLARTIFDMTQSEYAPLRAKAGRFKATSNSTRDIISTAGNETAFIDSPPITDDLASTNEFRFADMKDEIVTVYLILPATHLESHANWLRLIVASALRELLSTPASPKKPPVLFMLDEFSQLGHLPAIANAMNIARSYGVQLWPFIQDLNQLKDIYHDNWENFLGASAALTAFAPRDLFTSDYLSKLSGRKTIIVESQNEQLMSSSAGLGRGPQSAPLFRPEELRAMQHGQMLCFIEPVKNPFMTRAPGYWEMTFNSGLDPNPYHQG